MNRCTKMVLSCAILLTSTASLIAENMPFPQFRYRADLDHHMTAPAGISSMYDVVTAQYERYKEHIEPSQTVDGGYYVRSTATDSDTTTLTVSEAHGWGMIIMVKMAGYEPNAREYFDGLVKFYENFTVDGRSLMAWKIQVGEYVVEDWWTGANGTATDGDLDIAYALLLAHKQWGDQSYKDKAIAIIEDIKNYSMNMNTKLPLLGPWATGGSKENGTRPSDWMAGHMRDFATATGDDWWTSAAQEIYNAYDRFTDTHTETGALVPDFIDNGAPAPANYLETRHDGDYYVNASRVPFRFAADYATSQDSHAGASLEKLMDWIVEASEGSAGNIKYGYTLDGTPIMDDVTSAMFSAPFLAAATSHEKYSDFASSIWSELQQPWYSESTDDFVDAMWLLSLLAATGNWWGLDDSNTWYDMEGGIEGDHIILDHFSNEYGPGNAQSHLGQLNGVIWGDDKYGENGGDTTYYRGGGWWYGFGTSTAEITAKSGDVILSRESENADDMNLIVPENSSYLSINVNISDDGAWQYAGIGTPILEEITAVDGDSTETRSTYVDLSDMTALTVRARGNGDVRFSFGSQTTKEAEEYYEANRDEDDAAFYGDFGYTVSLNDEWTYHTIEMSEIAASEWSPLEELVGDDEEQWGWQSSGITAVEAFIINFIQDDDNETDFELEVDGIYFNGLTYQDIGLRDRPVSLISEADFTRQTSSLATVSMNQGIQLSFTASESDMAAATLYDLQGRAVQQVSQSAVSGANSITLSERGLSRGVYLLHFTLGNEQMIQRIRLQ
ncbi:glycosyl hydrolase family 8 [Chitinivibrio alkaliphilus]|uniref:Glucanase n=1 Tax=Chitinivibrio alkaliphilus ACht1 TaxID=1313304 RepID=U7D659_9BACT|nr:glycosyl hydrolase family 8 [Chitinivibrio alkaliphilus]ERP31061.1 glycoside hydrolase, GH8 family [Chitinivibrio alkaliphilus ACht1]